MTAKKEARPPHLVIVHGEKGGVGKSTVTRLLAAWLEERGLAFDAYDGDPMTRDFARFRPAGSTTEVALDDVVAIRPVLDRLMSRKAENPRLALVDLSAGAGYDLAAWLEASRALKAADAGRLVVTIVFVVGATRTSVEKLKAAHAFLGKRVSWILAVNEHLADKFEFYEASDARREAIAGGAVEIRIPSLTSEVYLEIDRLQIPFLAARAEDGELEFSWAGLVANFLELAFYQFDSCAELLGASGGR